MLKAVKFQKCDVMRLFSGAVRTRNYTKLRESEVGLKREPHPTQYEISRIITTRSTVVMLSHQHVIVEETEPSCPSW